MGWWSQLSDDLVVEIAERLYTLEDRLYFQAVCRPWRRILEEQSCLLQRSRIPWLLLPFSGNQQGSNTISIRPKNDKVCRSFFSVLENKVHHFEFPEFSEARGKRCCGSSYGWLTVVELSSPSIFLLNPLTRCRIDLPPITTLRDILEYQPDEVGNEYIIRSFNGIVVEPLPSSSEDVLRIFISKVMLKTDPTIPGCMAVAIYGSDRRLAFCRPGDEKWTEIGQALQYDAVFWRNQLYAVDWYGNLVACDIGVPSPKPMVVIDVGDERPRPKSVIWSREKYLVVDPFGELVMVARITSRVENHIHEHFFKTNRFDIYRMDQETNGWKKVDDLGDYILFLGINSAELFLAPDFPQLKPNSIYFTDNFSQNFVGQYGGHDIGIFNLKDRSFKRFPCCKEDSLLTSPSPVWFTPSFRPR